MNLEERLEALAAYHEDAAKSVRTTLALLLNGARETASKSLDAKLRSAIALRSGNGNGSIPPEPEEAVSPLRPGLRAGTLNVRIVDWLAKKPQTIASVRGMFGRKTFSMGPLITRGLVQRQGNTRPYTYTATAKGRAILAHLQARTGKARAKTGKRKGQPPGGVKGASLRQLREVLHGAPQAVDWNELQAMAKAKGLTFSAQTIGSATRYGHVTATGARGHLRYAWTGA